MQYAYVQLWTKSKVFYFCENINFKSMCEIGMVLLGDDWLFPSPTGLNQLSSLIPLPFIPSLPSTFCSHTLLKPSQTFWERKKKVKNFNLRSFIEPHWSKWALVHFIDAMRGYLAKICHYLVGSKCELHHHSLFVSFFYALYSRAHLRLTNIALLAWGHRSGVQTST